MVFSDVSRIGIATLILAVVAAGASGIGILAHKEKERELARWKDKLNLIADARAQKVNNWVETQYADLGALADNASLQTYFLTLQSQDATDANAHPPAQADYLGDLLNSTAERLGFQSSASGAGQEGSKNSSAGGLALVDMNGKQLIATSTMPPMTDALAARITTAPHGKPTLLDIEKTADGAGRMGFLIPIYGVQADHVPTNQIGMLVGIRPVDESLFSLMDAGAANEKGLEMALVRAEDDKIRYLTPLADASPAMSKEEDNAPSLAASYALAQPNSFAEKVDYQGNHVLVTGRAITNTPWTLVTKIDRDAALAASIQWLRTMVGALVVLLTALVVIIFAVWRNANARRGKSMSRSVYRFAEQSDARAQLLTLVTDHQPEPLYIVDDEMRTWVINEAAAEAMDTTQQAAYGRQLSKVAGATFADRLEEYCLQALAIGKTVTHLIIRNDARGLRTISTKFVPLESIPLQELDEDTRGVLITEQDVTALIDEREKRLHMRDQLIATLVSLVDRRDPNAAQHSSHVASIAAATAREMGLDAKTVETTQTAARLMNLGKMDVPTELLTRNGMLNDTERTRLRSSMTASADMLAGIEFDGPVTDTLRQAQEHMDGSGPLKLKGEDILISARIIAAVNAAVGMLSPRAYRKPMPMDEAINILQTSAQFDPKVVTALTNYLLNRADKARLNAISHTPQAA